MLGIKDILIQNCSFANHFTDAISPLLKNKLSLISLGYLDDFGFTFTSDYTQISYHPDYFKTYTASFVLRNCSFKKNSFEIQSLVDFDLSNSALINFFCDLATSSSSIQASKDYSSGNNSPIKAYSANIFDIDFENIVVNDGRPLINIFFNNIFELKNLTFTNVYLKDNSLWTIYGGFVCLYLITNSYDFSYNNYQISITNITINSCEGLILNFNHPIQKSLAIFDIKGLFVHDIYIKNHQTTYTLFAFSQINLLHFQNITVKKTTTNKGIFAFLQAQQNIITPQVIQIFIQDVFAYDITSGQYGGFYLIGLSTGQITNIILKYINLIFSDINYNSDAAACLYLSTNSPYITNFNCTDITLSSKMTLTPNTNVIYSVCFAMDSVKSKFSGLGDFGPSNVINCENSRTDTSIKSETFPIYLGSIKTSTFGDITLSRFTNHLALYNGINFQGSTDITFSLCTFSNLHIYSTNFMIFYISSLSKLIFKSNVVSNNYCSKCFGLFLISETSAFVISYCNITENLASDSNGFVATGSSIITITGCNYLKNKATKGSAMFHSSLSTIFIVSSVFRENWSYSNGMKLIETTFDIKQTKFFGNQALVKSANIYASINTATSKIWDCSFENPENFFSNETANANQKGHFIYVNDAIVLIQYTFFVNGYSYKGGAIYFNSNLKSLTLENVFFFNNTAEDNGGALYIEGSMNIISTTFSNNSCSKQGSNIYLGINVSLSISLSFMNSSKLSSIYLDKYSSFSMSGSTLLGSGNLSISGIFCSECSNVTINSSIIKNFNRSSENGSAIIFIGSTSLDHYDDSSFSYFIIENSEISNCFSSKGSALFIREKVAGNLTSTKFDNNTAISTFASSGDSESGKGGAIYFDCQNLYCYIKISNNNTFKNNYAEISGGAHQFIAMPIIFMDTTTAYYNNSAVYGSNQASYPVSIERYLNPPLALTNYLSNRTLAQTAYTLSDQYQIITSSSIISPSVVLKIIDEYGQVVSSDNSS